MIGVAFQGAQQDYENGLEDRRVPREIYGLVYVVSKIYGLPVEKVSSVGEGVVDFPGGILYPQLVLSKQPNQIIDKIREFFHKESYTLNKAALKKAVERYNRCFKEERWKLNEFFLRPEDFDDNETDAVNKTLEESTIEDVLKSTEELKGYLLRASHICGVRNIMRRGARYSRQLAKVKKSLRSQ